MSQFNGSLEDAIAFIVYDYFNNSMNIQQIKWVDDIGAPAGYHYFIKPLLTQGIDKLITTPIPYRMEVEKFIGEGALLWVLEKVRNEPHDLMRTGKKQLISQALVIGKHMIMP
jgi:hypothetical protein